MIIKKCENCSYEWEQRGLNLECPKCGSLQIITVSKETEKEKKQEVIAEGKVYKLNSPSCRTGCINGPALIFEFAEGLLLIKNKRLEGKEVRLILEEVKKKK